MGEVTNPPEEDNYREDLEEADDYIEEELDEDHVVDDLTSEEMEAIDNKLDALNLALDAMETKREKIHEQLIELLQSSREIRKELQEEQSMSIDSESKESA